MKSTMLRLALTGATGAYNYYRNLDNRKQREMYDALLDALREGARGGGNLLALAVDCARARATLGEISSAIFCAAIRASAAAISCSSSAWARTKSRLASAGSRVLSERRT